MHGRDQPMNWIKNAATWLEERAQWTAERGASMVEYALLVALIAVALIIGINALTNETSDTFDEACDELNAAQTGGGDGGDQC